MARPWSILTQRTASGTCPPPQVTGHGAKARISHLKGGKARAPWGATPQGETPSSLGDPGCCPLHSLPPRSPSRARGGPAHPPPASGLARHVAQLFLGRRPEARVHAHETQLHQACRGEEGAPCAERTAQRGPACASLRLWHALAREAHVALSLCHRDKGLNLSEPQVLPYTST